MLSGNRTKRIRLVVGLFLIGGLAIQSYQGWAARFEPMVDSQSWPIHTLVNRSGNMAMAASAETSARKSETVEAFAARDPIGFFEKAMEHYDRSVRDYTCLFTKQELVNGRMTEKQVMEAKFREKPFSIRLKWVENEDKCSRVLYVADRWHKEDAELAVVEPGVIARLFIPYVMRPIHGRDAQKSSRRTIDQFGLRNSLLLTLKYCRLAQEQNILDFKYLGNSKVNDRETLVFERRLPYTGEDGDWPDRVLEIHIDKELLLPTLCLCYADDAKSVLLGHYEYSKIEINPGLSDETFTKKGMGLE